MKDKLFGFKDQIYIQRYRDKHCSEGFLTISETKEEVFDQDTSPQGPGEVVAIYKLHKIVSISRDYRYKEGKVTIDLSKLEIEDEDEDD